jgi:uncharacterized membrane protein
MGAVREILGSGAVFGIKLWSFQIGFFASSAGAFFTYAVFIAVFSLIAGVLSDRKKKKAFALNSVTCSTEQTEEQTTEVK